MKYLLLSLLLVLGLQASSNHTAKILETMDSAGYTYMKIQEDKEIYWIAMTQRKVKTGDSITFTEQSWMKNFHSKTLNRTFDKILFASNDVDAPIKKVSSTPNIMTSELKEKDTVLIADLFANPSKYEGKVITVKGVVTKISLGIMKRNWVHVTDGSRFNNKSDLVFTTTKEVSKMGEVVYATGTVEKDIDFGFGYFYPVIIQNSSFK